MIKNFIKSNFPGLVRQLNRIYNYVYHIRFFGKKRSEVFSSIYKTNHWTDTESASGPGSTMAHTVSIRQQLPEVIVNHNVKSMLDIPCGDFNWMKSIELALDSYQGMDIVPELIERNKSNFENTKRTFAVADLVTDQLPPVDLIFCRDCLVHLSYKDIQAAIHNIKSSGSKYLLTTTFPQHKNFDIITGNWRPINLEAKPFLFPKPLAIFSEGEQGDNEDKSMALWRIEDLH